MSIRNSFFFFQNNIRWRRLSDLVYTLGDWLRETEMPSRFKKQLREAIDKVIWEVQRWSKLRIYKFIFIFTHIYI